MCLYALSCPALDDYIAVNVTLVLGPAATRVCTNITIEDNVLTEPTEALFVGLASTDPAVDLPAPNATVIIVDEDGECMCYRNLSLEKLLHTSMHKVPHNIITHS